MRILFKNLGQAEFYLKTCKRTLAANLASPARTRLPNQRIRNAICKGCGYSSYDEFKLIMSRRHEDANSSPAPDDMRRALFEGLLRALAVVEEYGIQLPEPAETLALRLTAEVLRKLS